MRRITIDVEDYRSLVIRDKLDLHVDVSAYVDNELHRLLDLLDEMEETATCFVVGRLAKERPHLVKEISRRKHEVASHSFSHLRMRQLSPREFTEDLRTSIHILEDIAGSAVRGFRAPAFSLGLKERWAFEIMAEEGIRFDSSVRVILPFGNREGQMMIAAAAECGIQEFPGIAMGWRRFKFPLAGGGGLRLIPAPVARWGMARVRRTSFRVPIYIHPYDLSVKKADEPWPDSSWPKAIRLKWFDWTQRLGRGRVAARLRNVLAESSRMEISMPSVGDEPIA